MTDFERKLARYKRGLEAMSAEEREAVAVALEGALRPAGKDWMGLVTNIVAARGRAMARRDSDKRTDAKRRVLVGAHVPRGLAERVRAAAAAKGVSQYRFLVDGIERMCDDEKAGVGREGGA